MTDDDTLTPGQAARLLGTTTTTLARWSTAGRLPCTRLPSGHRRYAVDDVQTLAGSRPLAGLPQAATAPIPVALLPQREPGIPALLLAAANALNAAAHALTHSTQETQ